jgi:hypothetical protein
MGTSEKVKRVPICVTGQDEHGREHHHSPEEQEQQRHGLRRGPEQSGHRGEKPIHRAHHPESVEKRGEDQHEDQGGQVRTLSQPPQARAPGVVVQLPGRIADQNPYVVVRTGVDALHAERAVQVPDLPLLEEPQLASVLNASSHLPAPDAILGSTRDAPLGFPDGHLEGRHHGVDEVELPDGAHVFAEGRSPEQAVDQKGAGEVRHYQPSGEPRAGPQIQCLVRPEE